MFDLIFVISHNFKSVNRLEFLLSISKTYLELCQTTKMERFAKIVELLVLLVELNYFCKPLHLKHGNVFFNGKLRSSYPEVFLVKGVLKICSKFTGEHSCRSVISIKLLATLLKSYFGMGVLL